MKEQLGVERSLDDLHPELEVSADDDDVEEKGEKDKPTDGSKSKGGSAKEGKKSGSQDEDAGNEAQDASERAKMGSWSSAADLEHDEL
jgi:hypothetical protein